MELLIDTAANRAVESLWDDRLALLPPVETGGPLPLTVGLLYRIKYPFDARLYSPQAPTAVVASLGAAVSETIDTDSATAGISVATVQTGGTGSNHQVRVALTGNIYKGTWTFSALSAQSSPIGWDDTAGQIKNAVASLTGVGTGNVDVQQEEERTFLLTFIGDLANTNITGISVDGTNLVAVPEVIGSLSLAGDDVLALLGEDDEAVVPLEVSADGVTVLRRDVLLLRAPGTVTTTETNVYTAAQIDTLLQGLSGSSPLITVSAHGTHDLAPATAFTQWYQKVVAQAGSGTYTHVLTLDNDRARTGAIFRVSIELPASANPTIEIRDNSDEGTLLQTVESDSDNAGYFSFEAEFDGTAWHKLVGQYVV